MELEAVFWETGIAKREKAGRMQVSLRMMPCLSALEMRALGVRGTVRSVHGISRLLFFFRNN